MDIAGIAALAPVIPVLTIERVVDAVPLAQALVRGGLRVLEITLRTPAALEALAAIADQVPEAIAGVGTVLAARQFEQARRAGARFAVSPGYTPSLAAAARSTGLPYLPGVQTVSEAMALADQEFKLLKLFPADTAGGITWLRAVAGPLQELRFCPTGGVTADTASDYLALANVACVGGSWVAPKTAVGNRDWAMVERLAATAAALKRR
jgi:2-dehydro-3-deoxyphosphogluconate aldolase / (4S)-4-hydroxy-2-oxoglutarate aldolase